MKLTTLPMTYGLSYRCSEKSTIILITNLKLSLEDWYKYCTIDSVQFTNLETVMNYILSLTLTLCFACGGQRSPTVQNPSGECSTADDGSRTCYHAPMQSDTYLPDCQIDLSREYWRVFATSESSAYIIPRPDGMGLFYDLCEDDKVGELMNTYALCNEILGANEVDIINDIPPADALLITNALHSQLFFTVDENDIISPWAPPNDIVDACKFSDDNDEAVSEFCGTALGYYDSGEDCPSIAFFPNSEEASIIAARLNTLYGLDLPAN